jgi:tight adherence protein C
MEQHYGQPEAPQARRQQQQPRDAQAEAAAARAAKREAAQRRAAAVSKHLLKLFAVAGLPAAAVMGAVSYLIASDPLDAVLSFGLAVVVMAFVMSVFSQPGRVQRSPQREVAIATGHADRRTLFEQPGAQQFMWVLLSLTHSLSMPRLKGWLRRMLIAEGNENYYTPEEYLALSLAAGAAAGGFLEILHVLVAGNFSIIVFVIGLVAGTLLSVYHVYDRAGKRLRLIAKRVPYTLDLVSLAMGAGATFTEAVRTVVREDPHDPFNNELKTVLAEMELGSTRRQALENLADRVPLDNLRSIVSSVIQAEELGTPLADVLHNQASLLRLQRSIRAENAAAVASVRMLVPALLILMAVVLTVFGPAIVRGLTGGLF